MTVHAQIHIYIYDYCIILCLLVERGGQTPLICVFLCPPSRFARSKRLHGCTIDTTRRGSEVTAGCLTMDQADALRGQVDRLRRERNEARADAMRWLEQQHQQQHQQQHHRLPGPSPATMTPLSPADEFRGGSGLPSIAAAAPSGQGASSANEVKAAAAIQKLKAKVDRLRKERDGAEKQAAAWLQSERERIKQEFAMAAAALPPIEKEVSAPAPGPVPALPTPEEVAGVPDVSDGAGTGGGGRSRPRSRSSRSTAAALALAAESGNGGSVSGSGNGGMGSRKPSGPVVASLKAESTRLKKELDESKKEIKRWRERASTNGSGGGIHSPARPASGNAVNGSRAPPEEEVCLQCFLYRLC